MESFQRPLHTVFMVSNIREVPAGVFTIEESMLNELSGMKICTKNTKPSTVGPLYPLQHLKSNASIKSLLMQRMHLVYHNNLLRIYIHAFSAPFHVGVLRTTDTSLLPCLIVKLLPTWRSVPEFKNGLMLRPQRVAMYLSNHWSRLECWECFEAYQINISRCSKSIINSYASCMKHRSDWTNVSDEI